MDRRSRLPQAFTAALLCLQLSACGAASPASLLNSEFAAGMKNALDGSYEAPTNSTEAQVSDSTTEEEPAKEDTAVENEISVTFHPAGDFFSHLTGSGRAGYSGQTYVDIQYYNGSYYYAAHFWNRIYRFQTPGEELDVVYASTTVRPYDVGTKVNSLCMIDDYMLFWDATTIVAYDLISGESIPVMTADECIDAYALPFYYLDGWIYTSLVKPGRVRSTYVYRFRLDEGETSFERLGIGRIAGMDAENGRLVCYVDKGQSQTGREYIYTYILATGENIEISADVTFTRYPAIEYEGKMYTMVITADGLRRPCSIDAEGNVEVLEVEAAQFMFMNGKMYYSKPGGGLYEWDMATQTEKQLSAKETPVPWADYDSVYIRPVDGRYIIYLADSGGKTPWTSFGYCLYDTQTGAEYLLD